MIPSSKALSLTKGLQFNYAGQHGCIHYIDDSVVVLKINDGSFNSLEPSQIYNAYMHGTFETYAEKDETYYLKSVASERDIKRAERILAYLEPLRFADHPRSETTLKRVIETVGTQLKEPIEDRIPYKTLDGYFAEWKEANFNSKIFTHKPRKARQSKFCKEQLDLVDDVIDRIYMTTELRSKSYCYAEFKNEYIQRFGNDGKCMGRTAFYDLMSNLDPYEEILARKGPENLRVMKNKSAMEVIHPDFPTQYIEIDAVHLNVGVLDKNTKDFLGTLIVYVAIDRYTRCIMGYSTSIKGHGKGETADAVIELLKHSVLPKTNLTSGLAPWPCFGIPTYIMCDAGSAFHNTKVTQCIAQIGATRNITQTKTPKKKPFIERFFRTLRDQMAEQLPGYTGSRLRGDEMEMATAKSACLTMSTIKSIIEFYIVEGYHMSGHKGLNDRSPVDVWNKSKEIWIPKLPESSGVFEQFFGPSLEGTIQQHKGIQRNNLFYQNQQLLDLCWSLKGSDGKGPNPKVAFSLNLDDISRIYVTDPNTLEAFMVPCTDKSVEVGTSLLELEHMFSDIPRSDKAYVDVASYAQEDIDAKKAASKKQATSTKPKEVPPISGELTDSDCDASLHQGQGRYAQKVDDKCSHTDSSNTLLRNEFSDFEVE